MTKKKRRKPFNARLHRRLALLKMGYPIAEDVERWYGGFPHDFIGFADLIVFDINGIPHLEQVTTESHFADHVQKSFACKKLREVWMKLLGLDAWIVLYPNPTDRDEGDISPRVVVL